MEKGKNVIRVTENRNKKYNKDQRKIELAPDLPDCSDHNKSRKIRKKLVVTKILSFSKGAKSNQSGAIYSYSLLLLFNAVRRTQYESRTTIHEIRILNHSGSFT